MRISFITVNVDLTLYENQCLNTIIMQYIFYDTLQSSCIDTFMAKSIKENIQNHLVNTCVETFSRQDVHCDK